MKKLIITAFALITIASLCACGPTDEEIAQTKWVMEQIEESERLAKEFDDTLAESEKKMDEINKEVEQLLGMSLDDALEAGEEGKTLDEKKQEMEEAEAAEPVTEEEAEPVEEAESDYEGPFWSIRVGHFDAMSAGLAKELNTNNVQIEDVSYKGYRIADILDFADIKGSFNGVRIVFADSTIAEIDLASLFENDTLLIIESDDEYLEQPQLFISSTLYEQAVIEIRIV